MLNCKADTGTEGRGFGVYIKLNTHKTKINCSETCHILSWQLSAIHP